MIIWSWFLVHLCNMTHIQEFFSFFQNFLFFCCYWGKRPKNGLKWQKILSIALHISGTIHHMIFMYGTHGNFCRCFCVFVFCHFFKILIFQVVRGVNGWKRVQNDKNFCHLSNTCKMILSPGFFLFFQNFYFLGLLVW